MEDILALLSAAEDNLTRVATMTDEMVTSTIPAFKERYSNAKTSLIARKVQILKALLALLKEPFTWPAQHLTTVYGRTDVLRYLSKERTIEEFCSLEDWCSRHNYFEFVRMLLREIKKSQTELAEESTGLEKLISEIQEVVSA